MFLAGEGVDMTQKAAIERLAKWREAQCELGTSTWGSWAAAKYLDLLAGNVQAVAVYEHREGRSREDMIASAIDQTHATIQSLVEGASDE